MRLGDGAGKYRNLVGTVREVTELLGKDGISRAEENLGFLLDFSDEDFVGPVIMQVIRSDDSRITNNRWTKLSLMRLITFLLTNMKAVYSHISGRRYHI